MNKVRIPWGIKSIGAPSIWHKTKGERIHIGVIDTGIDFHHPDLRDRIGKGINLLARYTLPTDDNGHGTHIAGIIAAASTTRGITGVAPEAIIHPIKAFDHQGSAYAPDIVRAIDWCVDHQMHIINMSFGMQQGSPALEEAVKRARAAGVIVCASSGNDGKKRDIDYPARYPEVIAVGATTRRHRIAPFTNRSRNIDIYAPGDAILSTWLHGRYETLSGTSMATSHVSGLIALILARRGPLSCAQIRRLLQQTALPLRASGVRLASGEANAIKALRVSRARIDRPRDRNASWRVPTVTSARAPKRRPNAKRCGSRSLAPAKALNVRK